MVLNRFSRLLVNATLVALFALPIRANAEALQPGDKALCTGSECGSNAPKGGVDVKKDFNSWDDKGNVTNSGNKNWGYNRNQYKAVQDQKAEDKASKLPDISAGATLYNKKLWDKTLKEGKLGNNTTYKLGSTEGSLSGKAKCNGSKCSAQFGANASVTGAEIAYKNTFKGVDVNAKATLGDASANVDVKAVASWKTKELGVKAEAGAVASVLTGKVDGSHTFNLPFGFHLKLSGSAEGSVLTAGAKGSVGIGAIKDAKGVTHYGANANGKIGAAILGGGLGFGIDVYRGP